ncbi:MAG: ferritin-like domain-containing protein [Burkholderiaceae bacterium]
MTAMRNLLDEPETRFPLDLGIRIPKIRQLYRLATAKQWDPHRAVPWDTLRPEDYSEEQRLAARMYWSRRAWSEYGAISESPALQIRFWQEKHAPDLGLFFALRTQEESRHAEVSYLFAEKLGGYIQEPKQSAFQGAVATHGVRRMALDLDIPLEATIASLVCAAEELAFDMIVHVSQVSRNPAAKRIFKLIARDEVRHCAFGWHFMEQRLPHMSREQLQQVQDATEHMIGEVYLNGYQESWLAPDSQAARDEVEADRITYEAGLGATIEPLQRPVFIKSTQRIRELMKPWGITLKQFYHPKLGTF